MKVELLFWRGCPSHPEALETLRAVLDERRPRLPVELVEVDDRPGATENVIAALRSGGLDVRLHERSSAFDVVAADADLVADAVRDAVALAGARVGRIVRRRRRLEDLFEGARQ